MAQEVRTQLDVVDVGTEGENLFSPYNPENKEITLSSVQCILKKYGLPTKVHNLNLYRRAFVHTSYVKKPAKENEENGIVLAPQPPDTLPLKTKSNERLEFLGDGILEAITKFYLYRRFPKENEGFMTEKKIALVKNEAIGRLAYQLGLHHWMIISRHAEEKGIRTNVKKLGCLFEAFLGAIFLDNNKIDIKDEESYFANVFHIGPGFQMAQLFLEAVFERHIDWIELLKTDDNYKNQLQVMIQKQFKTTPDYLELSEHNTEDGYHMGVYLTFHSKVYNLNQDLAVRLDSFKDLTEVIDIFETGQPFLIFMGEGLNKTKKKAEQIACQKALEIYKSIAAKKINKKTLEGTGHGPAEEENIELILE
jgi:dsRNA-specific ribonuclease